MPELLRSVVTIYAVNDGRVSSGHLSVIAGQQRQVSAERNVAIDIREPGLGRSRRRAHIYLKCNLDARMRRTWLASMRRRVEAL